MFHSGAFLHSSSTTASIAMIDVPNYSCMSAVEFERNENSAILTLKHINVIFALLEN